jgi:hypothetical protein
MGEQPVSALRNQRFRDEHKLPVPPATLEEIRPNRKTDLSHQISQPAV